MGSSEDVNKGKKRGLERSKVMLAFSGGPSSRCVCLFAFRFRIPGHKLTGGSSGRALLDLVEQFFPTADAPSQRNARFKPPATFASLEVVFIDESGVAGHGVRPFPLPAELY
jgi:hypothetical protein